MAYCPFPPFLDFKEPEPRGNTYEIKIKFNDTIIITVEHPDHGNIQTRTVVQTVGTFLSNDGNKLIRKTDFSFRSIEPFTDK